MMKSIIYNFTIITITILMSSLFQSCEKQDLNLTIPQEYPGVDSELWKYFQNFEQATAEKGIHIDLISSEITGSIKMINIDNVTSLYNADTNLPKHVMIDKEVWVRTNQIGRELIVFHELELLLDL